VADSRDEDDDDARVESSLLFGMCCVSKTSVGYMVLLTIVLPLLTLFFLHFGDVKNKEAMCDIIQQGIDFCNDAAKYTSQQTLEKGSGMFKISVLSLVSTGFTTTSASLSAFKTAIINLSVDVSMFHMSIYELVHRKWSDLIAGVLAFFLTLPLTLVAFAIGTLTAPMRAMLVSFEVSPPIALLVSQTASSIVVYLVFISLLRIALKVEASVWREWCCCLFPCCNGRRSRRRARERGRGRSRPPSPDRGGGVFYAPRPHGDQHDLHYQVGHLQAQLAELQRRQQPAPVPQAAQLPTVRVAAPAAPQ
jgi:hypothetical protein